MQTLLKQLAISLLSALPILAQSNTGELRLKVTDPSGLGMRASVEIAGEATQLHRTFDTEDTGTIAFRNVPFGLYPYGWPVRDFQATKG